MTEIKQELGYIVRPMQEDDIPQAIEIDREAFPTQWPHPTHSYFKQELKNRLAHYIVLAGGNKTEAEVAMGNTADKNLWQRIRQLKYCLTSERFFDKDLPSKEVVVGTAGFWLMAEEAHITTIVVREAYQRQGMGERLLISIGDMATQLNARMITLEVRISNESAQALYKKYGFQKVGVRKGYYSDNNEDALLMTTENLVSAQFQSRFQQLKWDHKCRWGKLYSV